MQDNDKRVPVDTKPPTEEEVGLLARASAFKAAASADEMAFGEFPTRFRDVDDDSGGIPGLVDIPDDEGVDENAPLGPPVTPDVEHGGPPREEIAAAVGYFAGGGNAREDDVASLGSPDLGSLMETSRSGGKGVSLGDLLVRSPRGPKEVARDAMQAVDAEAQKEIDKLVKDSSKAGVYFADKSMIAVHRDYTRLEQKIEKVASARNEILAVTNKLFGEIANAHSGILSEKGKYDASVQLASTISKSIASGNPAPLKKKAGEIISAATGVTAESLGIDGAAFNNLTWIKTGGRRTAVMMETLLNRGLWAIDHYTKFEKVPIPFTNGTRGLLGVAELAYSAVANPLKIMRGDLSNVDWFPSKNFGERLSSVEALQGAVGLLPLEEMSPAAKEIYDRNDYGWQYLGTRLYSESHPWKTMGGELVTGAIILAPLAVASGGVAAFAGGAAEAAGATEAVVGATEVLSHVLWSSVEGALMAPGSGETWKRHAAGWAAGGAVASIALPFLFGRVVPAAWYGVAGREMKVNAYRRLLVNTLSGHIDEWADFAGERAAREMFQSGRRPARAAAVEIARALEGDDVAAALKAALDSGDEKVALPILKRIMRQKAKERLARWTGFMADKYSEKMPSTFDILIKGKKRAMKVTAEAFIPKEDAALISMLMTKLEASADAVGVKIDTELEFVKTIEGVLREEIEAAHPGASGKPIGAVTVEHTVVNGGPLISVQMALALNRHPGQMARVNIHELAHVYFDLLKQVNPKLFESILEDITQRARQLHGGNLPPEFSTREALIETFVHFLESDALLGFKRMGSDGTLFGETKLQFGKWVARLIARGHALRMKFNGYLGEKYARKFWRTRSGKIARQFSDGDWFGIFTQRRLWEDPPVAVEKTAKSGIYTEIGGKVTEEELGIPEGSRSTREKSEVKVSVNKRTKAETRRVDRTVRLHPDEFEKADLPGLGEVVIPKGDWLSPQVRAAIQHVPYGDILLAIAKSEKAKLYAKWYHRSAKAIAKLADDVKDIIREEAEATGVKYDEEALDSISKETVAAMVGFTAARRGPMQNTKITIEALAFYTVFPGAFSSDTSQINKNVTRLGTMLMWGPFRGKSMMDIEAIDVLRAYARDGDEWARGLLELGESSEAFPRPGEKFVDWVDSTSIGSDSRDKLLNYFRAFLFPADPFTSVNDTWEWIGILRHHGSEILDEMWRAIARGDEEAADNLRERWLALKRRISKEKGEKNTLLQKAADDLQKGPKRLERLRKKYAKTTDPKKRKDLAEQISDVMQDIESARKSIDDLEAAAKKGKAATHPYGFNEKGEVRSFTPNKWDYEYARQVNIAMAKRLTEMTGMPWDPSMVQAAKWGLLGGGRRIVTDEVGGEVVTRVVEGEDIASTIESLMANNAAGARELIRKGLENARAAMEGNQGRYNSPVELAPGFFGPAKRTYEAIMMAGGWRFMKERLKGKGISGIVARIVAGKTAFKKLSWLAGSAIPSKVDGAGVWNALKASFESIMRIYATTKEAAAYAHALAAAGFQEALYTFSVRNVTDLSSMVSLEGVGESPGIVVSFMRKKGKMPIQQGADLVGEIITEVHDLLGVPKDDHTKLLLGATVETDADAVHFWFGLTGNHEHHGVDADDVIRALNKVVLDKHADGAFPGVKGGISVGAWDGEVYYSEAGDSVDLILGKRYLLPESEFRKSYVGPEENFEEAYNEAVREAVKRDGGRIHREAAERAAGVGADPEGLRAAWHLGEALSRVEKEKRRDLLHWALLEHKKRRLVSRILKGEWDNIPNKPTNAECPISDADMAALDRVADAGDVLLMLEETHPGLISKEEVAKEIEFVNSKVTNVESIQKSNKGSPKSGPNAMPVGAVDVYEDAIQSSSELLGGKPSTEQLRSKYRRLEVEDDLVRESAVDAHEEATIGSEDLGAGVSPETEAAAAAVNAEAQKQAKMSVDAAPGAEESPAGAMADLEVDGQTLDAAPGLRRGIWEKLNDLRSQALSNKFANLNKFGKTVTAHFMQWASVGTSTRVWVRRTIEYVTEGATQRERELFVRYGWHVRRQAIIKGGIPAEKVKLPGLSPAELEEVKNSPTIQRMIQRWKEVWPEVTERRLALGLKKEKLQETEGDFFMSLIPYNPDVHGENASAHFVGGRGERGSAPKKFTLKKTKFRMRATGTSEAYLTDPEDVLFWSVMQDASPYMMKKTVQHLEGQGMAVRVEPGSTSPGEGWRKVTVEIPRQIRRMTTLKVGKDGSVVAHSTGAAPAVEYWMPKDIADHFERQVLGVDKWVTGDWQKNPLFRVWAKFGDVTTGLKLLSWVEAFSHGTRVVNTLTKIPQVGQRLRWLGIATSPTYIGPRMLSLWRSITVTSRSHAPLLEKALARIGSYPDRTVANEALPEFGGAIGKKVTKVLHSGRDVLFGMPTMGKPGLKGLDVRARMVALDIWIKDAQASGRLGPDALEKIASGELMDFDVEIHDFLNRFGNFNNNLQSWLVRGMKGTRLNPFAGAQAGMRPNEIATFFGFSGLGKGSGLARRAALQLETLAAGTAGLAATYIMLNKWLSGHYPWENEPGRELYLDTGIKDDSGAAIYVHPRVIAPDVFRAARTTMLRYLVDDRYGLDVRERTQALPNAAINEVLGTVAGAPVHTAMIAASGKVPYIAPGGDIMQVARPRLRYGDQAIENLKAAFAGLNPNIEAALSEWAEHGQEIHNRTLRTITKTSQFFTGKFMVVGKPPAMRGGEALYASKKRLKEVTKFYERKYISAFASGDREEARKVLEEARKEVGKKHWAEVRQRILTSPSRRIVSAKMGSIEEAKERLRRRRLGATGTKKTGGFSR